MRDNILALLRQGYQAATSVHPGAARALRPAARLARKVLKVPAPTRPEAYVVGYPKVGNTWFQIMLRKAIVLHLGLPDDWIPRVVDPDPAELPSAVPAIGVTHNMPDLLTETFHEMEQDFEPFHGKRVVLLTRDPKDVLVSLFMQYTHREEERRLWCPVDEVVSHEIFGLDKYLKFYRQWNRNWNVPENVHLVRYEDMKQDTFGVVKTAFSRLGLEDLDEEVVGRAVEYGSFENMRQLEKTDALGLSTLAPSQRGGRESFKVRRGKVGGYADYLAPETIEYINRRTQKELPKIYGYPLDADPIRADA